MHTVTCFCGERFTAQRSTARYCSSTCRAAACKRRQRREARYQLEEERGARFCGYCTNEIPPWDRIDKLYCSPACKQAEYRESKALREAVAWLAGVDLDALRPTAPRC